MTRHGVERRPDRRPPWLRPGLAAAMTAVLWLPAGPAEAGPTRVQAAWSGLEAVWDQKVSTPDRLVQHSTDLTLRVEQPLAERWTLLADASVGANAVRFDREADGGRVVVPLGLAAHVRWAGEWVGLGLGLRAGFPFAHAQGWPHVRGVAPVLHARVGPSFLHGWFGWRDGGLSGNPLHAGLVGAAARWQTTGGRQVEVLGAYENFGPNEFTGIAHVRVTGERWSWLVGLWGGLCCSYGVTLGVGTHFGAAEAR